VIPVSTLWSDDNGQLVCTDHAGAYLTAAIAARPKARTHRTPLGRWAQVDRDELVAAFAAADIPASAADCETCQAGGQR
jgi:hypothetical protein